MRAADEALGVEDLAHEVEGLEGDGLPAVVDLLREEGAQRAAAVEARLDLLPEVAHELLLRERVAARGARGARCRGGHGGGVLNTASQVQVVCAMFETPGVFKRRRAEDMTYTCRESVCLLAFVVILARPGASEQDVKMMYFACLTVQGIHLQRVMQEDMAYTFRESVCLLAFVVILACVPVVYMLHPDTSELDVEMMCGICLTCVCMHFGHLLHQIRSEHQRDKQEQKDMTYTFRESVCLLASVVSLACVPVVYMLHPDTSELDGEMMCDICLTCVCMHFGHLLYQIRSEHQRVMQEQKDMTYTCHESECLLAFVVIFACVPVVLILHLDNTLLHDSMICFAWEQ